jgi:hypothetical protein
MFTAYRSWPEQTHDPAPEVRERALRGWFAENPTDPDFVVALAAALHDPSDRVRETALELLGHPGGPGKALAADLARSLVRESNDFLRARMLETISQLDLRDAETIRAIAESLLHPAPVPRLLGLRLLTRYGPAARVAVPLLQKLLIESNLPMQALVRKALEAIDPRPHRMEPPPGERKLA